MKKPIFCMLLLLIFVSCDNGNDGLFTSLKLSAKIGDTCTNGNQNEIFNRIESYINEGSSIDGYKYILRASHENETVFIFGNCCPFCNSLPPPIYNCSGEFLGRIEYFGYSGEEQFSPTIPNDQIVDRALFWPENSICRF